MACYFAVSSHVDQAASTAHVWRKANVLAIEGGMVKVHFEGWNTRYDEWLTISGGRLRQGKKAEGLRAEELGTNKRRKGIKQTATASEAEAEGEEEAAAEEEEAEGSREVEGDGVACVQCAWGDDEAGNELLLCDSPSCDAAFHQRCADRLPRSATPPHTLCAGAIPRYYPLSRCLPTPLDCVPAGKWLCPACVIWLVERSGLEVEGVKGLVIWLWYPLHAQHHRAVVDGVHTELQGGRLGSVTKVHVRFEAEPGDVSRSAEPLPLASLKHVTPQVAEERDSNPAGWDDNSSRTYCLSPPTSIMASSQPLLALPPPPRAPQGASAPAQSQSAARLTVRPLRCLEICACTGRLSMTLRAHGWEVAVHDRSDKSLEQPLAPVHPCLSTADLAAPSSDQMTKWLSCNLLEIEPEELPLFDYIHASLCCATYSPMSQEKHQRKEDNNYLGISPEAGCANEELTHLVAILQSQKRRNPAFLFSLENPGGDGGGKMQHAPKVKEVIEVAAAEGGLGAVRCDVTYCMFERGVKKPTHLWTNSKARLTLCCLNPRRAP